MVVQTSVKLTNYAPDERVSPGFFGNHCRVLGTTFGPATHRYLELDFRVGLLQFGEIAEAILINVQLNIAG